MTARNTLKSRDVTVKVISKCGLLRLSVANTTNLFRETLARHDLVRRTFGDMAFLRTVGGNISFSNLLASFLDSEERVESRLVTPQAAVVAESLALGECRAFVTNPPTGCVDHALRVQRVLYRQAKPVVSVTVASWADLEESFELGSLEITPEAVDSVLSDSMTLHAANFMRKSEGATAAVGLWTNVKAHDADDTANPSLWEAAYCGGILLQSVVDSTNLASSEIFKLQRGLVDATLPGRQLHALWEGSVLARAKEHQSNVQDMLALATGDYEGAFEVAKNCRLHVTPIDSCIAAVEPLRLAIGLESRQQLAAARPGMFAIDTTSHARTPLDFFCRCSKADFMQALCSLPKADLEAARGRSINCQYCRKEITLTTEEWDSMLVKAK